MSLSSTKSKFYQVRSYPKVIVSRNTTFRWHKNHKNLCYVLPLEMPSSRKLPIQIRMLPRSPACNLQNGGDIYCSGVHLDSLQTMANLGCGTSWDAMLA